MRTLLIVAPSTCIYQCSSEVKIAGGLIVEVGPVLREDGTSISTYFLLHDYAGLTVEPLQVKRSSSCKRKQD